MRGKQLADRCTLIRTGAFPCHSEWQALIATLEGTLRMHRHQPGTLVKLGEYLHQRTGGMIGSLSYLIRAAAISASLDGSEAASSCRGGPARARRQPRSHSLRQRVYKPRLDAVASASWLGRRRIGASRPPILVTSIRPRSRSPEMPVQQRVGGGHALRDPAALVET